MCNYTDQLGEQKGIILSQVKGPTRVHAFILKTLNGFRLFLYSHTVSAVPT